MKIVINKCFGGFSLSNRAVRRMAELSGRKCFFFKHNSKSGKYIRIDESSSELCTFAFDIENPTDKCYKEHYLDNRPEKRDDPILVRVVEELGKDANGSCASLGIVEIPDGTDYEIEDYDGMEHVAEKHQTWY